MKDILEVSKLVPKLYKKYDGDFLEVLSGELDNRGLFLEQFILELAKMVNTKTEHDNIQED
jgi:hypothetical protein